jgi:hypothetical protein
MIEDYDNGNGIIYQHNNIHRPNQFIRKDDPRCFIYYELNDTTPISIYVDIWNCVTTVPLGSGRILMKDFFEFMKKKSDGEIDDNTVVSLTPMPDIIENSRISKEKRTLPNLIAYYKSINFDNEYVKGKDLYLSGTIGNIIDGINNYRKNGVAGGIRKTKRKKSTFKKSYAKRKAKRRAKSKRYRK